MIALAALRLPLIHWLSAAAVTAVFVAWFTQNVLREVVMYAAPMASASSSATSPERIP